MKKKFIIILAGVLLIPVLAYAANVGLGGEGLYLVILSDGPSCDSANKGAMYYDDEDNTILYCDGSDYQTVATE